MPDDSLSSIQYIMLHGLHDLTGLFSYDEE